MWSKIKAVDSRFIWIFLGLMTILIRLLVGTDSSFIEKFYSRGLFLWIRNLLDYTTGLLPIPMLYILILVLIVFIVFRFRKVRQQETPIVHKIGSFLFTLIAFIGGFIFLFQLLWGFNYSRISLEDQLGITPKPLKVDALKIELEATTKTLEQKRTRVSAVDSTAFTAEQLPPHLETKIREELEHVLNTLGYPTTGSPRLRLLRPKGVLLRISTAGFYLPFGGECNVDSGLHPIQLPFVIAHEYAHAYGITDEGSCNFLAYLSCINSSDPFIQYSGFWRYWSYLAYDYRRLQPEAYRELRANLPIGILNDITAISENLDKYPDIFPSARNVAYDTYLKTQGISEGLESYDRIVVLVKAWKDKQKLKAKEQKND